MTTELAEYTGRELKHGNNVKVVFKKLEEVTFLMLTLRTDIPKAHIYDKQIGAYIRRTEVYEIN
eukprot:5503169-Ditylum_brightwellii.AAC.1